MFLLISAHAHGCEPGFSMPGGEVLSIADGAVDIPPDILPASTWVGAPGFDRVSGWPVALRLTDALGADVLGEEELLPNRVVFHPEVPLATGATYTITGHAGQVATFTVGAEPMGPPDEAPALFNAALVDSKENTASCSIIPNYTYYTDLLGTLSAPTAGLNDDVISWTRIFRVADADSETGEIPGTWVPSGTAGALLRWLREDEDGLACFRFQEEDGAGNLSDISDVTCLAADPSCGCSVGARGPGGRFALAGLAGLVLVRRRTEG